MASAHVASPGGSALEVFERQATGIMNLLPVIETTEECSWQPQDSWEALRLVARARNEIVHVGASRCYVVGALTDAWYPFEFVRDWVAHFDANFDALVFEGVRYPLVEEYERRRRKAAGGDANLR